MIKVKLSIPGFGPITASQFLGNCENICGRVKFFINDPTLADADYWFVLDDLNVHLDSVNLKNNNAIFLNGEVIYPSGYYDRADRRAFLSQFSAIHTHLDIYGNNVTCDLPFLPWMINANHGATIFGPHERDVRWFEKNEDITKAKTLSVICSAQTPTSHHVLRLKFVAALKAHFKDRLDWFGNGINSTPSKWEAIAPYKYHIVLENQARFNVITEKPGDAYLGLAYPFYFGAPNVHDVFGPGTATSLNIYDLKGSIRQIESAIECGVWERALPALKAARAKVLDDLNLFKRIARIAEQMEEQATAASWSIKRVASMRQIKGELRRAKPVPYLLDVIGTRVRTYGEKISASATRRIQS